MRLQARSLARKGTEHRQAVARVRDWVRARFGLGEDDTVMVAQVDCNLPGCPPLETVIAFWTEGGKRHHYKIFKPVAEVVEDDLPPGWMKDALAVSDDFVCDCC